MATLPRSVTFAALCLLSALPALPQEGHGFTAAELQRGEQMYLTNCAQCHGPDGDQISGVNLGGNRFRKATTDREIATIIQKGIPGTAMPPGPYADDTANLLVAYLHSMATAGRSTRNGPPGDATRGKSIVETKGGCLNCHRIGAKGVVTGPDLSAIGARRRIGSLETSLLDPSAEIRDENRPLRAVTKSGSRVTGTVLNQDTYTVQILDAEGRLRSLYRDDLRELELLKTSPMPSFKGKLTEQEISDVVAYLTTLKGQF